MSVIYFFLTAMYQARIYSLCLFKKIKQPVLFSCKLITEVTGKFAQRNSCGYCVRHFGKVPRQRLQ